MALEINSIGPYFFIALEGEPIPPRMQLIVDERLGVDGAEFVQTGRRGSPFSLLSRVDAQSYEATATYLQLYQDATAQGVLELVKGGVSSVDKGWKVKVLDVQAIRRLRIAGSVGFKLNAPSLGWIEARWDLLAVPIDT